MTEQERDQLARETAQRIRELAFSRTGYDHHKAEHIIAEALARGAATAEEPKPFRMNVSREWIERMAKIEEECGDVSVGAGGALRALVSEVYTLCVQCGPNVNVDEYGCCAACGCDVMPSTEALEKIRQLFSRGAAPAGAQEPFDLVAHLHRQRAFSERTFGPGARTAGVLDHIRKELREIEAKPTDISEWIDVVLLALDGAWRAGHTPEAIAAALAAKQAKNEARQWPDWRTAPKDQAIQHVKSAAPQPPSPTPSPADQEQEERA